MNGPLIPLVLCYYFILYLYPRNYWICGLSEVQKNIGIIEHHLGGLTKTYIEYYWFITVVMPHFRRMEDNKINVVTYWG